MNVSNTNLWTALVTPMLPGGEIDFKSLEFIVQKQVEAGNGILLIGSTGEGLALPAGDKWKVVEFVSKMNPASPLMVGVGGFDIELQKKWIEKCNPLHIDAFLLVSPLYSKPGPVGMERWFRALLDRSEKPCMIYNIPGRTGIKVPPEVIMHLQDHSNMWSLKEASGSLEEYNAFRMAAPELDVFSGDDALLPEFVPSGCNGLVSVASNVWPEEVHQFTRLCLERNPDLPLDLWEMASKALFVSSNPIPAKVLLAEKGWIRHPELRLPLTPDELTDKSILLKADSEMTLWYAKLKTEKTN